MTKARTVFYSWQSDRPSRANRGFIGDALDRVAEDIRADDTLAIEPVVDRDTAGVPGSPAISDTILEKIARSDIFVADVSLITPPDASRPSPNPNVLLELGYAIREMGWDRIVMVMNTTYGPVEQLPFDLRGRRVAQYSLPDSPGEPKADVRRDLQRQLNEAIVHVLHAHRARAHNDQKSRRQELIHFAKGVRDEALPRIANGAGVAGALSSPHLICIHAVPFGATANESRLDVSALDSNQPLLRPIASTGFPSSKFNGQGLIRLNAATDGKIDNYLQFFRNGTIESVDSRMMIGRGREDGLPSTGFAFSVSSFVTQLVTTWVALEIAPPACIFISLLGLTGISFLLPEGGGYIPRRFTEDQILLPEIVLDDFAADPRRQMKHSLDVLWQTVDDARCPFFNSSGDYISRF